MDDVSRVNREREKERDRATAKKDDAWKKSDFSRIAIDIEIEKERKRKTPKESDQKKYFMCC